MMIGIQKKIPMGLLIGVLALRILLARGSEAFAQFPGDVEVSPRTVDASTGEIFDISVLAFVGGLPMGAYDIDIVFDPNVVIVEQISGGATAEFSDGPLATSLPETFISGTVSLVDFNTSSLTFPLGQVSLATITFRAVGQPGDSTPLTLIVNTLADTSEQLISSRPINGFVSLTELVGVSATIDFHPETLNLKSQGRFVTVFIELGAGLEVDDIVISSIRLNNSIPAEPKSRKVGDRLMVKFDRTSVQQLLRGLAPLGSTVEVVITGELVDGTAFTGSDLVRIIEPGE